MKQKYFPWELVFGYSKTAAICFSQKHSNAEKLFSVFIVSKSNSNVLGNEKERFRPLLNQGESCNSFQESWKITNVTQQFQELALKFRTGVNNTFA